MVISCSKESTTSELSEFDNSTRRDKIDCSIELSQLSTEDQFKQVLAKFTNDALRQDGFREYLLGHLYNEDRDGDDVQNPEFLIAKHLNDQVNMGASAIFGTGQGPHSTLEDMLLHWVSVNNPDQLELFQNLCNDYANFVLQFPWWSTSIINSAGGTEFVNIGTIGSIEPVKCDDNHIRTLFSKNEEQVISVTLPFNNIIPIYIKKSEDHIQINNSAEETLDEIVKNLSVFYEECTFTNEELVNFVETIDCSDLSFVDFTKMSVFFKKNCSGLRHHETDCCDGEDNDGDGLIDCEDVEDCPCEVEICNDGCDNDNDGHIDEDDEDCQCEGQWQRDCVPEQNVIVGLKFGEAAWTNVCQVKEENNISVKFNFDAVEICTPTPSGQCPLDPLTDFVIQGHTSTFFEIQKRTPSHIYWDYFEMISGDPSIMYISEEKDEYWKVYPLYVGFRKEYLDTKMNQWIPSDIGSRISLSVYEEDNTSVSTSQSITNSITTRHSVNAGATIGLSELISTNFSYTFDQTKVSSATSVTNLSYEKDVFINNYSIHYWDEDEVIPDPTGVEGNTWYGHIPGNSGSGLDALYLEFRIHD